MECHAKVYVAGHTGLVGSAIMRALEKKGYTCLLTRTSEQLDLRNQAAVEQFFMQERPEYIFLAAARVGGIHANMAFPAQFIYDNLMIQTNIVHAAYKYGATKLLFLGSSCIYPRECQQPIKEEYLLTSPLESTNEPYAIAKIAGIKLCQSYNRQYQTSFITAMPTNIYGPGDTFDLALSHVVPALLIKFLQAKEQKLPSVSVWGTGKALRELLYVDDLAEALLLLMTHYDENNVVNIGSGIDHSIHDIAHLIKDLVHYKGAIYFDDSKPDGTPRKLLESSKIQRLGWQARTSLKEGILHTMVWYQNRYQEK